MVVETILPLPTKASAKKEGISQSEQKENKKPPVDALLLAYMYIFESVLTNHDTIQIQAKSIESNAIAQNKLINLEGQFNFTSLRKTQLKNENVTLMNGLFTFNAETNPSLFKAVERGLADGKIKASQVRINWTGKQVTQTTLENMSTHNQEISAIRGVIEESVKVDQQNVQMNEANMNSSFDEDQDDMQEGASIMEMLTSLSRQITRI